LSRVEDVFVHVGVCVCVFICLYVSDCTEWMNYMRSSSSGRQTWRPMWKASSSLIRTLQAMPVNPRSLSPGCCILPVSARTGRYLVSSVSLWKVSWLALSGRYLVSSLALWEVSWLALSGRYLVSSLSLWEVPGQLCLSLGG